MAASNSFAKIDCHAHFVPDFYHDALLATGHTKPDGMPYIPSWSVKDHLAAMDELSITKAILSISSPGVHLGSSNESSGAALARRCNDYAAQLKKDNPTKFGFWASLPLPDVQGSLTEIAHALDDINADGFAVDTNYDGIYLGDSRYDPIFAELDRRHAKLFIHPTTPCIPNQAATNPPDSSTPSHPLPHYPSPLLEFFFDTARTVANLFMSGTIERHPNITYIIPHAGGALPPLIKRFSTFAPALGFTNPNASNATLEKFPGFVSDRLRTQFYFDTAGWCLPEPLKDLLQYVPLERIVYGSDFPWSPLDAVKALSRAHDQYLPELFPDDADVQRVCSGNAMRLLERGDQPGV